MKIFFPTCTFYPAEIGGPVRTLLWHTEALNQKSEIEIRITSTTKGIGEKTPKDYNQVLRKSFGSVYYAQKMIAPRVFVQSFKNFLWADIIHLNSFFCYVSIMNFFLFAIFFPNKKIIWSPRGELSEYALSHKLILKKILIFTYKIFQKNITFHATSSDEKQLIESFFPESKTILLPNFIKCANRLEKKKGDYFIFLGRIHPIKNIKGAIRAFGQSDLFIEKKFKFFIVGGLDDRYLDYFKKLKKEISKWGLQDYVEFKGHIDGLEKQKLLANAYFMVLPSESENFGNVVIESLNQGTPVIASKGTPWSILNKERCGYHVTIQENKFYKVIDESILLSENEYFGMVKNSWSLVDDLFSISHGVKEWEKIYNTILNV